MNISLMLKSRIVEVDTLRFYPARQDKDPDFDFLHLFFQSFDFCRWVYLGLLETWDSILLFKHVEFTYSTSENLLKYTVVGRGPLHYASAQAKLRTKNANTPSEAPIKSLRA